MPKAKLSSFTAACCCLICCMACACAQCVIHNKYECPQVVFDGQRAIVACIKEKERLDRAERKQYMLEKLNALQVRVTMTGKYYFTWQIENGSDRVVVCQRGFEVAYNISSWYVDDLISRIKDGDMNVEACFTDRSAAQRRVGLMMLGCLQCVSTTIFLYQDVSSGHSRYSILCLRMDKVLL